MPINSKTKGKVGELEATKAIKKHLGFSTRRTAQVDGKLSADLIGINNTHIEIKRRKAIAALHFLRQAEADKQDSDSPMVLMREDGDTEWVFMCRLKDLKQLAKLLHL